MLAPPELPLQLPTEIRKIAKAMCFALASIVIILSYPAIRLALAIDTLAAIGGDMFKGKPLPILQQFMFAYQSDIIRLSICLPIVAIVALLIPRPVLAIYILSSLVLITGLLALMLGHLYFNFVLDVVKDLGSK